MWGKKVIDAILMMRLSSLVGLRSIILLSPPSTGWFFMTCMITLPLLEPPRASFSFHLLSNAPFSASWNQKYLSHPEVCYRAKMGAIFVGGRGPHLWDSIPNRSNYQCLFWVMTEKKNVLAIIVVICDLLYPRKFWVDDAVPKSVIHTKDLMMIDV